MKTLYLVRHAKASKAKSNSTDSERSLNKKGKTEADKMAKKIPKNGNLPDLIISSPAKRAIQTASRFAKTMHYPSDKIILDENLYKALDASGNDALLKQVLSLDDQ